LSQVRSTPSTLSNVDLPEAVMDLDFRNVNTLWASLLVNTLAGLGLQHAVICPGSRSSPLAIAFSRCPRIEKMAVLDERSAAFFALGLAKQTRRPVVFVCTSGTAGANAYGAIIEARHTGVPLLILTADRPPELRDCHAGQTIDQLKLFGQFPRWQVELAVPEATIPLLAYLRQTMIHAWERSLYPTPGAVHLNCPFRDPLAPQPDAAVIALATSESMASFQSDSLQLLTQWLAQWSTAQPPRSFQPFSQPSLPFQPQDRGIILVGLSQPQDPQALVTTIAHIAKQLQWPVLTDALNPLRNYEEIYPYSIATYDLILRHPPHQHQLQPTIVLQVGELPTSKELRQWLNAVNPLRYVLHPQDDPSQDNFDPLQGKTIHLRSDLEALQTHLERLNQAQESIIHNPYLQDWLTLDRRIRSQLDQIFDNTEGLREPKIAWFLSQCLPHRTPLWIANSTPVRDMEWFWLPHRFSQIQPFFNRGANGIDGTLSAALGMVHGSDRPGVLLTGDLSLLHDTNGFLQRSQFRGHLTIVLINNQGGGIFELLPIARFDPPFEQFFALPQAMDFAQLCRTYGVSYTHIQTWQQLQDLIQVLPSTGIRVLEIKTDRKQDAVWRKTCLLPMQTIGAED